MILNVSKRVVRWLFNRTRQYFCTFFISA